MTDTIKVGPGRVSSRRAFVGGTLRLPLAAFIAAAVPWTGVVGAEGAPLANLGDVQARMLGRMLYLLFPFPELGEAPYARSLAGLDQQAADAATRDLLQSGVKSLDHAADGAWLAAGEETQVLALKAIEKSRFFQHVLGHVQATLFNDRELWKFVGYEGSSLEFGGYADHGANDIDWLDDGRE